MDTEFGRFGAREYLAFAVVLLILLMGSAAHAADHTGRTGGRDGADQCRFRGKFDFDGRFSTTS